MDLHNDPLDARMRENQGFDIWVDLVGPTDESNAFLEPQMLTIEADLDFDGSVESDERFEELVYFNNRSGTAFEVFDDGKWSVDHEWTGFDLREIDGLLVPQKINDLHVTVTFGSDSQTKVMEVENFAPILTGTPVVEIVPGPSGSTMSTAIVNATIFDEGIKDAHRVTVTWGDGIQTITSVWEMECDPRQGTIQVARQFGPNDVLYPVTILVEDDDSDTDTRQIQLLDLNINDDDDNSNLKYDLKDTGVSDDDLKLVNLDSLKRPGMDPGTGYFKLQYDLASIRLWTSASKTTFIYQTESPMTPSELGLTGITTMAYTGQSTAYVEGLAGSGSYLVVNWYENDPPDLFETCYEKHHLEGDSIFVRVWGVDIDTDSDNDSAINLPETEEAEDIIEDQAGHGKRIFVHGEPAEIVLEVPTLPIAPTERYRLELIVAAGLNLWTDSGKTTRLTTTTLVTSTIPSNDELGEKYVWNKAWSGEMKFYIEGSIKSEPAARRVQWRLIDNQGTIVAPDAVRFIVAPIVPKLYSLSFLNTAFTITSDPHAPPLPNIPNPPPVTPSVRYEGKHWLDENLDGQIDIQANERAWPVAYVRNSSPKLEIELKLNTSSSAEISIQGSGNGIYFKSTRKPISANTLSIEIDSHNLVPTIVDESRFLNQGNRTRLT